MKIIFAGTPIFAASALEALIAAGHEIVTVLTQPDRPAGRGMKLVASAVKISALKHGITVLQLVNLKSPVIQLQLQHLKADVMVVAAYGLILPEVVLNIPQLGCLNIHASLLPRWRGAAPIQRAILAGDDETGITIMQMDAGLDTGAMLLKKGMPVGESDTTAYLHDKLCILGAQSIVEALAGLQQGSFVATVQDDKQACYAAKIKKIEAAIDWQLDAKQINRVVRAFNPSPGAYTHQQGKVLKIWQAKLVAGGLGKPGEVISVEREGIIVACGEGALMLKIVQKPGGKKMSVAEYLAGNVLQPGDSFD